MKDKKTFPWSELLKKWFVFYTIIYLIAIFLILLHFCRRERVG
jgi:hypothetical protein